MKRIVSCLLVVCCLFACFQITCNATEPEKSGTKRIVLTFDDGPHPKQTRQILDVLDRYGIKATFFVIGVNVKNYPGIIAEVQARGHEIANHTTTHSHASRLDMNALQKEIKECDNAVYEQIGKHCKYFRPPEGAMTDSMRQVVKELGYTSVFWTLDTRDWAHTPPDQISDYIIQNAKNGDIILMHDYIGANSPTVKALERFIPVLLQQGFTFVTAGELLQSRNQKADR